MKTKMQEAQPKQDGLAPTAFLPGKDELNLAEFPIALLSDRVPAGQKTIEFKDQIYDERKGQPVTRSLTITASDKYGLPTPKDDEVILALIQLTKEANNFTERTVKFSRADLIRLLGWPDKGQSFRRIALSLSRWLGVSLYYENAWWEKEQQSWTSRGFHIIESFEINDGRSLSGQMELLLSQFTWNEVVFRSFQAGYLKRLDLDVYLGLKHPTAKRMYRFLDKRFYHRPQWSFDLREFAHEHIGLSRAYADSGKLKEKLQPGIEELEAIGFLEPMGRKERFTKVGRGEWKIAFAQQGRDQAKDDKSRQPNTPGIAAELTARGVTASTAAELVTAFSAEHISGKIDVFDWLVGKKDKRVSKSPAGYLVESIRENYAAPVGFVSRAEREKRDEADREKRRQEAEAKQRQKTEQAREAAAQAKIKKHWNSLARADQEQLDRDAIENAPEELRKSFETSKGGPVEAMMKKFIREAHIRKLLGIPEAPSPAQ